LVAIIGMQLRYLIKVRETTHCWNKLRHQNPESHHLIYNCQRVSQMSSIVSSLRAKRHHYSTVTKIMEEMARPRDSVTGMARNPKTYQSTCSSRTANFSHGTSTSQFKYIYNPNYSGAWWGHVFTNYSVWRLNNIIYYSTTSCCFIYSRSRYLGDDESPKYVAQPTARKYRVPN
jgi:hypothetical protein